MSTKRSAGAASMRKCSKSLLILLCVFSLKAQNIPTNSWRTHVSYSNAKVVTGAEGIVFCGVENGLFVFQDNQVEILSKSDGLSNSQPTALTFDPVTDLLLIGYEGGVVDIMGDETVTTIEELSLLSRPSNKRINDIVINGNLAFVATNFGIGVIDLITLEIREFFSEIGPSGTTLEIFELLADEETIFAATERGVLKGSRQSNLLDFNNWTTLPNTAGVENLLVFENRLLATSLNQLVEIDDSIQAIVNLAFVPTAMSSSANGLYILSRNELVFWDTEEVVAVPVDDLLVAAEDLFLNEQSIWVADRSSGLVQVGTDRSVRILPNGPANDNISKLRFVDQLYAFYSGNPGTVATPDFQGYSTFDGNWANEEIDGFTEVSDIGILDGNRYFSSISSGVFDDSRNELLSNVLGNDSIITAITAAGGQLWFASYGGTNALYQLAENTWTSYSTNTVGTSTPLELTASAAGTLWIINDISQGGGTYTFTTEDNLSIRRSIADGVPSNVVLDVAIDRRDEAWLATDQGPAVFFDASFSPSGTVANLPTFQSSTLFQNESVNAVAIDGGNRKWIGTDQGVWVFDANLNNLDQRFTEENSPLLDNVILDFAYDPGTGEIFILTGGGLCSFQTGSSEGQQVHSNVNIFPNPVPPNYFGPVTLKGLAENVNVKITDIQGRLVTEISAIGGTATWNLKDLSNNDIDAGVYLCLSSSADGEETFVGKIAVIR